MSMTPVYFHIGSKRKVEPKEFANHSIHCCLTAYTRDSPAPTLVPFFNPDIDWDCYVLSGMIVTAYQGRQCLVSLFNVSQS